MTQYSPKAATTGVFLLILLGGAFFRFFGLDIQSFWNDELSSWYRSNYESIREVIEKGIGLDYHPPGYQLLLFFVEKYSGDTETILRLPSAIAGTISIILTFFIGLQIYTPKEALIASSLMAFSWLPLYYSQEARPYAILLLLSLLTTSLWLQILKAFQNQEIRGKGSLHCGYIMTAMMACYLHYFGLLLIFLQGVGVGLWGLYHKRALTWIILIYGFLLLAYLPWLFTFWDQLNYWDEQTTVNPAWLWKSQPPYLILLTYLHFCFNRSIFILGFVLFVYLFFLVHKICYSTKNIRSYFDISHPTMFVLLWLVIPLAFSYIISIRFVPILILRNLIISLPAVYLLLSRAMTQLPLKPASTNILSCSFVALILAHNIFINQYYTKPSKEQFREAANFIIDHQQPYQDQDLIIGYAWSAEYFHYYFEKRNFAGRVELIAGQKEDISMTRQLIVQEEPRYVWYIIASRKPEPEFMDFLHHHFSVVVSKEFVGANVWLFENMRKLQ